MSSLGCGVASQPTSASTIPSWQRRPSSLLRMSTQFPGKFFDQRSCSKCSTWHVCLWFVLEGVGEKSHHTLQLVILTGSEGSASRCEYEPSSQTDFGWFPSSTYIYHRKWFTKATIHPWQFQIYELFSLIKSCGLYTISLIKSFGHLCPSQSCF